MRVWVPPREAVETEIWHCDCGECDDRYCEVCELMPGPFTRVSWWEPDERLPFPCVAETEANCAHLGLAKCREYCREITPPYAVGEVLAVATPEMAELIANGWEFCGYVDTNEGQGAAVMDLGEYGECYLDCPEVARRWIEVVSLEPKVRNELYGWAVTAIWVGGSSVVYGATCAP